MSFFKSLFSKQRRSPGADFSEPQRDPEAEKLVRRIFGAVTADNPYGEVVHNPYGGDDEARQMDELVAMGDRAARALGHALKARTNSFTAEGMIACLGRIGSDQAARELGRVLAMPDDNTMETMRTYEAAVHTLMKIGSPVADDELTHARSGPAAAYVKAIHRPKVP